MLSSLLVNCFLVFMRMAIFLIFWYVEQDFLNAGHIWGKFCADSQMIKYFHRVHWLTWIRWQTLIRGPHIACKSKFYLFTHSYFLFYSFFLNFHFVLECSQLGASQVAQMVKNPPTNAGDIMRCEFDLWVKKIPWRREWQPSLVSLSGEFHGQKSLVGCSPQGCKD